MSTVSEPNYESLDYSFDHAVDVAKGECGTFYLQTNSPDGHCAVRVWMHPHLAEKLRDWLNANYPVDILKMPTNELLLAQMTYAQAQANGSAIDALLKRS